MFLLKLLLLLLVVQLRHSGINKEGGIGRIRSITNSSPSSILYSVTYVLGGKEDGLLPQYVSAYEADDSQDMTRGENRSTKRHGRKLSPHPYVDTNTNITGKKDKADSETSSIGISNTSKNSTSHGKRYLLLTVCSFLCSQVDF